MEINPDIRAVKMAIAVLPLFTTSVGACSNKYFEIPRFSRFIIIKAKRIPKSAKIVGKKAILFCRSLKNFRNRKNNCFIIMLSNLKLSNYEVCRSEERI
jgi:hypothetical protein